GGALLSWQGAAAPRQDGGCLRLPSHARSSHVRHTTHPTATPAGPQGAPALPAPAGTLLGPLLATLSQPAGVQASPAGPRPRRRPALVHPRPDHGPVGHDLVYRRLPGRALRDRPRLLRRRPPEAQAPRPDCAGLPEAAGPAACGLPAGPRRRVPAASGGRPGRGAGNRRLHRPGLIRLPAGVYAL